MNKHVHLTIEIFKIHLKKLQIIINQILKDINTNVYSCKYLNKIEIYGKFFFKINQILIRLSDKQLTFNNRNDSFFLYLRNYTYKILKYVSDK